MRISKIECTGYEYSVTRIPNMIERFFGITERVDKYQSTGRSYTFGGGRVYVNQQGRELGNNFGYGCNTREAIDCWRRSF